MAVSFREGSLLGNYHSLVGGFNPFEKYERQIGFIFPKFRGENSKKYLSCHHPVFHDSLSSN